MHTIREQRIAGVRACEVGTIVIKDLNISGHLAVRMMPFVINDPRTFEGNQGWLFVAHQPDIA